MQADSSRNWPGLPKRRLPEPRDLLIICGSLITVTEVQFESRGTVETVEELRLAHFSVKEYLTSSGIASSTASDFTISETPANAFIADSCLAYIPHVIAEPPLVEERLREHPLIRYATRYWSHLASAIEKIEEHESLRSWMIELFSLRRKSLEDWIRLWDFDKPEAKPNLTKKSSDIAPQIYYYSRCGLHTVVRYLLDLQIDVNSKGGVYGTPLQAGAVHGSFVVVKLLLDSGPKDGSCEGFYGSALGAASYCGHKDIAKLSLDSGIDVRSKDDTDAQLYRGQLKRDLLVLWIFLWTVAQKLSLKMSAAGLHSFG